MKLESRGSTHKKKGWGSRVGPLKQRGGQRREGVGCHTTVAIQQLLEWRFVVVVVVVVPLG